VASGHLELERDKITQLRTVNPRSSSTNYFNYSQFRDVTDADNQYRFEFTWMPIVDTHRSFLRGNGGDESPIITEPDSDYYDRAENEIHFGEKSLGGNRHYFLITAYDGVYNTTYVSDDWNFDDSTSTVGPLGSGDTFELYGESFRVESFQNRENDRGALLFLSQDIKTFGASVDSDAEVISLDRYASMEGEPIKVRVLAW